MKTNKFWSFFLTLTFAICSIATFSSCGTDDHEDPIVEIDPYDVVGTSWSEDHSYSDGTSSGTSLSFSSTTATLRILRTEGTQTLTTTYNFTFRRAKNLVVLTPKEEGIATLEGRIDESGIKMTLTNASNNSVVATLYKR